MTTPKDKLIQTYSLIITASTVAGAACSFIENFERSRRKNEDVYL